MARRTYGIGIHRENFQHIRDAQYDDLRRRGLYCRLIWLQCRYNEVPTRDDLSAALGEAADKTPAFNEELQFCGLLLRRLLRGEQVSTEDLTHARNALAELAPAPPQVLRYVNDYYVKETRPREKPKKRTEHEIFTVVSILEEELGRARAERIASDHNRRDVKTVAKERTAERLGLDRGTKDKGKKAIERIVGKWRVQHT